MLKLGNTDINKAYLGSTEINKIYLGANSVYEKQIYPLWYPFDEASNALWLEGENVELSGSLVNSWTDQSVSPRTVSQATAGNKFNYSDSGFDGINPSLLGDGGDFLNIVSSLSPTNGYTWVFLVRPDNFSAVNLITSGSTGSFEIRLTTGGNVALARRNSAVLVTGNAVLSAGQVYLISVQTNNLLGGAKIFVNGSFDSAWTGVTTFPNNITSISFSSSGFVGAFCDVQCFLGEDDATRFKAEGFICNKRGYNSLLPWDHPYKDSPPTSAAPIYNRGTTLPEVNSAVFFGDSITAGQNASAPAKRWVNTVAGVLQTSILNQGIAGTVLQNSAFSGGSPQVNNGRDRYSSALTGANKRDIVIINYGLNDLRYTAAPSTMNIANFVNDYQEIITGLLSAGYTNDYIVLCSPYWIPDAGYMSGSSGFTGSNRTIHESYVSAVAELSLDNNLFYADVYSYMRDNGGESLIDSDNIHPIDIGHDAISQSVLNAIKL